MRCLEKDRTRRYETANGLSKDVERYLHDEPVEACPRPILTVQTGLESEGVPASCNAQVDVPVPVGRDRSGSWKHSTQRNADGESPSAARKKFWSAPQISKPELTKAFPS
jgi:hypothetical protein